MYSLKLDQPDLRELARDDRFNRRLAGWNSCDQGGIDPADALAQFTQVDERLSVAIHFAAVVGPKIPGDDPQQRGFPGAVGPQQSPVLAALDSPVDRLQSEMPIESMRNAKQLKDGRGRSHREDVGRFSACRMIALRRHCRRRSSPATTAPGCGSCPNGVLLGGRRLLFSQRVDRNDSNDGADKSAKRNSNEHAK